MSSARHELLRLLATKSFKLGEFKLSSGATSDYYIDCRTTTLDARGSQLTGQIFLEEIRDRGWDPQAIGGLTMAPIRSLSPFPSQAERSTDFSSVRVRNNTGPVNA